MRSYIKRSYIIVSYKNILVYAKLRSKNHPETLMWHPLPNSEITIDRNITTIHVTKTKIFQSSYNFQMFCSRKIFCTKHTNFFHQIKIKLVLFHFVPNPYYIYSLLNLLTVDYLMHLTSLTKKFTNKNLIFPILISISLQTVF